MNNNLKLILGTCAVVLLVLGVFYFYKDPAPAMGIPEPAAGEAPVDINVGEALGERILGNSSAPVRVAEHSSFTCGHCGHFHQETFGRFKTEWIDTGKAYLVFSDFPLNAPALHASMTARCLPKDKYFDFVQMLYEKQDEWAYKSDYVDYLRKAAEGYGMNAATFEACLGSQELQEGILKRMNTVQTMWKVDSTPSFVINNKTVISGALPYDEFVRQIGEATSATGSE